MIARSIEAQRHRDRLQGSSWSRNSWRLVADKGGPTMREFLRVAGMDRDSAVIRWGNFDWTLALSSAVFEPDDTGRSYRLKPNTRSVWLINLTINKVLAMFEIPDTPEARRLGEAVGGRVVPGVGPDDQLLGLPRSRARPGGAGPRDRPRRLEHARVARRRRPDAAGPARSRCSGRPRRPRLDPEHGTSRLLARAVLLQLDGLLRPIPPQFVIISICDNDFGDMKVDENWDESEYWLDVIAQFCRTRGV